MIHNVITKVGLGITAFLALLTGGHQLGAALRVCTVAQGCTGTSTLPVTGQVLVGQSNGTYAPQATSTLGVGGSSGITSINGDSTATQTIATSSQSYTGSKVTTSGGVTTFDLPNPITFYVPRFATHAGFSSTFGTVGFTATAFAGGAPAAIDDSQGSFVRYSTTTANTAIGLSLSGGVRADNLPDVSIHWRPSSTSTDVIYWVGIGSNLGTGTNIATTTPSQNVAAFRFASNLDGTFWHAITNDASLATFTDVTTAVALATSTPTNFRVKFTAAGTQANFYINNVLVATSTTNTPNVANSLGATVGASALTSTGQAIDVDWISSVSYLQP